METVPGRISILTEFTGIGTAVALFATSGCDQFLQCVAS